MISADRPHLVVGIDEAGRGPLAGPVIAAAVILDPQAPIAGLADSKKLTRSRRETLELKILEQALYWGLGRADVVEIDQLNILQASLLAMRRAVESMGICPELALVDGNRTPALACPARAIVRGDAIEPAISAASILAKVARDREMVELDVSYPGYGFGRHKGYPTRSHLEALARLGPAPVHRRSFSPIRRLITA